MKAPLGVWYPKTWGGRDLSAYPLGVKWRETGERLANVSEVHAGEKHVRDPGQPLRGIFFARARVV